MVKNITILGAGSWGTALAILLANNNHNVKMYSIDKNEVDMINNFKEHKSKLPGISIPESVFCTNNLEESLKTSEVVVFVVPSQTVGENAKNISKYLVDKKPTLICCSKGIDQKTGKLLSDVIKDEIPNSNFCVLSGPSHAEEVAAKIPTAVVAASEDINTAKFVQDIFMNKYFRVYTSTDVIGVEVSGAIKNVIAVCSGISEGLGFGDNTKAALMTRGISEISRLGVAMGACEQTFFGLAGIGDLIVTCTSLHSRNRRAGILIGKGSSLDDALNEVKMVVEGVETAKVTNALSKKWNVSMPICEEAYQVLFNNKEPKKAVWELMMRDKKDE